MAHPTTAGAHPGTVGVAVRGTHRWLVLVIGAVFLLIGVAGFLLTGVDGFTGHDHGETLLGLAVNPLHNVVHILVGVLGLAMWKGPESARTYGWILFVVYTLAFVYGLVVANDEKANLLTINGADNVLHILSALAGLAIALWPRTGADRLARADLADLADR